MPVNSYVYFLFVKIQVQDWMCKWRSINDALAPSIAPTVELNVTVSAFCIEQTVNALYFVAK